MHDPSIRPSQQSPTDIQKRLASAVRLMPELGVRELSAAVAADSGGAVRSCKSSIHAFLKDGRPLPDEVIGHLVKIVRRLLRQHVQRAQRALENFNEAA